MKTFPILACALVLCGAILSFSTLSTDDQLRTIIKNNELDTYTAIPDQNPAKVELGRMLFFDKELSGNRDISCATCHHPSLGSADELPLAIGVGGSGLGKARKMGADRERVPRNSPDIFNRGTSEWHTMFWDNRVSGSIEEGFETPLPSNEKLPDGLDNLLAVQALFPLTSRDEMRGEIGDLDVFGQPNELALISDAKAPSIWHRVMLRLLSIPAYQELFETAYPNVKPEDLGIEHAANAIAAFEIAAFTFEDSPWDQYIAGQQDALNAAAKEGALVFYGKGNCSSCHSGKIMTDQQAHNIGVPQFGPGKGEAQPLDVGRFLETGMPEERFAFRTPPLKNTAITGPWMHNGAYSSLEEAIRHHVEPEDCLEGFDSNFIPEELRESLEENRKSNKRIIASLDPELEATRKLNEQDILNLMAFLEALTDESAKDLGHLVPETVPSGLPVAD
jgi:cytochrome c peroxidase